MRVTRRSLKAENTNLHAQLAVRDHVSRSMLNECVIKTRAINKELATKNEKLEEKASELQGKLDTATAALALTKKAA